MRRVGVQRCKSGKPRNVPRSEARSAWTFFLSEMSGNVERKEAPLRETRRCWLSRFWPHAPLHRHRGEN
jgi:hypothetical protein